LASTKRPSTKNTRVRTARKAHAKSSAAKKGWETHRQNARATAAKKGWETRRKNARATAAKKGWETRRQTEAVKAGVAQRHLQVALFELEQDRKRAANARGLPEHGILRDAQRESWLRWRRAKRKAKMALSPNGKPVMGEAFVDVVRRIGRKLGLSKQLIESYVTS